MGGLDRRKSLRAGSDRLGSNTRERVGEMLGNAGGEVDGEHLGGPLGGEMCML
jgi:hypothetical protein